MNTHLFGVFPKVQTLKPKIRKRTSHSIEEWKLFKNSKLSNQNSSETSNV
jgi:hypothetical protein